MKGYRSTKFWSVEKIEQHQWRVDVGGKDADGNEQVRQTLCSSYQTAIQTAAKIARELGLKS